MTYFSTTRLFLAGAALVMLPGPVWALDGQDLLAKINAAYAAGSGKISASAVEVDGDDVLLKGVTLTVNTPDAKPLPVGDLTLKGVSEEDGGAYYIERLDFPAINFIQDKASFSVADLYLAGIHVPASTTSGDIDSLMLYEEAHSGPISVTVDGKPVFSIAESSAEMGVDDEGTTLSFEGEVTGIKGDLSMVEDAKSKEAIEKLGLTSLDGKVTMKGSWELPSGTIDVEEYAFDFASIGRLNLAFTLSGYTMELVKQLQETARTMQTDPNNQQAQQAAGLAMLGLAQQMNFVGAEIRFEDDGITKRGLDYAGAQQGGMSGEDIGQMVKGMVPLLLAQAKLGDIQNTVSAAVNAYIDKPESFTITAAPENPVPFPMIMGASMGAPETLPKVLGIDVTAND
ncbi:hypothetical protein HFC70_17040 [Agrobacterium sp. a22-2]|uniref:hypothetical protein n=1 Tax=Agrobacterium sp. a22-2 TaxID=2283840 RepID=UPI0014485A6D|nr:hypothetical protein [Agrobacterium sp. a22-2]NKN38061.1 hypothetical protein [Agrobacterium sp. a22-2]